MNKLQLIFAFGMMMILIFVLFLLFAPALNSFLGQALGTVVLLIIFVFAFFVIATKMK